METVKPKFTKQKLVEVIAKYLDLHPGKVLMALDFLVMVGVLSEKAFKEPEVKKQ